MQIAFALMPVLLLLVRMKLRDQAPVARWGWWLVLAPLWVPVLLIILRLVLLLFLLFLNGAPL